MQTVIVVLLALVAGAALLQRASYRLALEDWRSGNWDSAYERFADLANRGDPDGARMALLLYRTAPTALRSGWDTEDMDLSLWMRLAETRAQLPEGWPE